MPGGAGTPGGYQRSQSYSRSYNPGAGGVVTHQPTTKPPTITTGDGPSVTRGGPPSILNRPRTIPKGITTTGGISGSNNWKKFINDVGYYGARSMPFFSRFKKQVQPTNLKGYTTVYHGSLPKGAKPGTFKPSRIKAPFSTLDDYTRAALNLPENVKKFVQNPSLKTAKGTLPHSKGVYVGAEDLGYAKENLRRGVKFTGKNTGEVYRAKVPNRLLDWSTNMYGQKQAQIPSAVANQLRNIKEKGIKTITDSAAFKAIRSPIGKSITRAMPWVGGAMGITDAGLRFNEGDYLGGALSLGSAIPVAGLGFLGGQYLTDKFGLTGENRLNQAQGGIVDLYRHGGF